MPFAKANSTELCYDTFGDPTGRPLLLIMGLASQMILWPEAFCGALAEAGHFVIRFDNRDIGRSTWIEDAGKPKVVRAGLRARLGLQVDAAYTLDDMADDSVGLLDALGVHRAHVCGVSMGGMIAQTMAIRSPSRVASLTSMLSSTGHPWRAQPTLRAARVVLRSRGRTGADYLEHQLALWRTIGSPGFPFPEAEIRARSKRAWERGLSSAGVARQLTAIMASGDRTRALRKVSVPTLVVHGTKDPLIPVRGGRATAAAIPKARLHVFEGMGHDLPRGLWPQIVDLLANHTRAAHRAKDAGAGGR